MVFFVAHIARCVNPTDPITALQTTDAKRLEGETDLDQAFLITSSMALVVGGWWLVVGGWWLVVGGWWLVVGGWWLVVGGWWLVVGGWWLVVGGWWLLLLWLWLLLLLLLVMVMVVVLTAWFNTGFLGSKMCLPGSACLRIFRHSQLSLLLLILQVSLHLFPKDPITFSDGDWGV